MNAFFRDIFEYHHHFNQQLADIFIKESGRVSERTIPVFSHCINAHQIWNSRITGDQPMGVNEVHSLEKCKELDRNNFQRSLEILEDHDLKELIDYPNSKGSKFSNSIQEIFFHISNHFTHHKGQLISDLRQAGIEPPVTDYIFYKRNPF